MERSRGGGRKSGAIAATAGVSRTTFYEQFATKEACFHAACDADDLVRRGRAAELPSLGADAREVAAKLLG